MQAVYADTLRWRDGGAPFGVAGIPLPQASRATENRVAAESDQTLSDMALATARTLLDSSAQVEALTLDQIIVCTTSFEHDLALSCACRLHSELGSSRAPLAVGQLQGVSFLMALEIAVAMMAADIRLNTVVIVAAERWRRPFSRRMGALVDMGDGAAAVLIARHPSPGWRVRGLTVRTSGIPPLASEREPIYTSTLTDVIGETCASAGFQPGNVDWVLPAPIDTHLAHEIHTRCGLRPERACHICMDAPGHFCAADTPARLDALLQSINPNEGQHALVWSAGFQGQAGCALLEFRRGRS
ncbi:MULTISPECIES: 3-oxoacyl-[acyl-carrier-protein] synthase III C-terminal domain-containing protein [unclassified Burkholderia]|uniref:3-oxoacyl-[acyl-carrier-protein] synthase III C-terminal domain-containing protein n=1 Tax=unclassified Burkholderia TaxID=2613784 RepID=UPI0021AB247F|nr:MULTISPECIES: 3-oxoacyl-[acyl-carrier-protein] synthase III C-terminal domain-containing protein [unclassified Burkholderia]